MRTRNLLPIVMSVALAVVVLAAPGAPAAAREQRLHAAPIVGSWRVGAGAWETLGNGYYAFTFVILSPNANNGELDRGVRRGVAALSTDRERFDAAIEFEQFDAETYQRRVHVGTATAIAFEVEQLRYWPDREPLTATAG
jgi:hypothetical protein